MNIFRDAPLKEFVIHNISEEESGYTYRLYIHARGPAIIARINPAGSETRFAKAGRGTQQWANRETLEYITYDKLQ